MTSELTEIWIYPLKSGRGLRLEASELTAMGLAWDRRWMLIDPDNRFISQRESPQMARLEVSLSQELGFRFGNQERQVPLPPYELPTIEVSVWHARIKVQVFESSINNWFSRILQRPCRLVFMPETTYRRTNPGLAPGKRVSFADGYPYLLCNLASLDDLNARLEAKGEKTIGIERFRPNLVIRHELAFAEDDWQSIDFEGLNFKLVKPCERCVIITTDQISGAVGKEPLTTLAGYRRQKGKVIFGQNLVCESKTGRIEVGMRFEARQKLS